MSPREETALLAKDPSSHLEYKSHPSDFEDIGDITLTSSSSASQRRLQRLLKNVAVIVSSSLLVVSLRYILQRTEIQSGILVPTGPYRLVEAHEGSDFFDYYDFYEGPDSLGSAGYNMYVSKEHAEHSQIVDIIHDRGEELVYMSSAASKNGPRNSIRLEGKRRFERGLFLLDVRHMPNGPGVWPAFWLTDEAAWPRNGEIDILEGQWSFFALEVHVQRCVLVVFLSVR